MYIRPGDELLRLCVDAHNVLIAAPYIKVNALTRILEVVGDVSRLICVTRWDPYELALGVSDAECRTIVEEYGGSFRLHPSLHAKYYRIDDEVLIGSANLTYPALGWVTQPNLEILCRAGDDFDALTFENMLLEEAREITDDEFSQWEAVGKINNQIIIPTTGGQQLLDEWRPVTRDPRNLEFAYSGQTEEIASFDEQRAANQDIQAMQVPLGLGSDQLRTWAATSLLAAPFTNTVIRLRGLETVTASNLLAQSYGLSITEARRDMETVKNWLKVLAPNRLF